MRRVAGAGLSEFVSSVESLEGAGAGGAGAAAAREEEDEFDVIG